MADPERTKEIKFFTDPPAAIDLTVDQALRDFEDYLPGGEKFIQGTSDRVARAAGEETPVVKKEE